MAIFQQTGDLKNNTLAGNDGPSWENDIFGDAIAMKNSKGGDDILTGGVNAQNHLYGDALTMNNSKGGDDIVIGGAKDPADPPPEVGPNPDNVLCGDTGDLSISTGDMTNSKGGSDTLTGGAYAYNVIAGDTCNIMNNSQGGNDILTGGAYAANIMVGDAQGMINSQGGDDRLVSGANAKDQMWGDFADDLSKGGTSLGGNDIFVFAPGSGLDFINDFNDGPTGPQDRIDVSAYGFDDINDLVIVGNGTAKVTVAFDGTADQLGDEVVVNGFAGSVVTLKADDYIFV